MQRLIGPTRLQQPESECPEQLNLMFASEDKIHLYQSSCYKLKKGQLFLSGKGSVILTDQ